MNIYATIQLMLYAAIIWKLGFIYGVVCIVIAFKLIGFVTDKLFNLEFVSGNDLVSYFEDPNNYTNCVCALVVDGEIDIEQFKEQMVIPSMIKKYKDFRMSLVNICGLYFWKKLPATKENVEKAAKQVKLLERELKTKDDITEVLRDIASVQIPRDQLQWEMYCGKYQEKKTVIVMKFHHAVMDGMSGLLLVAGINGCLNPETIPQMKDMSTFTKIMLTILTPFYHLYSVYLSLFIKNDATAFKLKNGFTGEKILAHSKEYDFKDLSKAYKKFDNTKFNDFFMGTIGVAIKKYSKENGCGDCTSVGIGVPASLRPPPQKLEDLTLENMIGIVIMGYPCEEKLSDSIQKGKKACAPYFTVGMMWSALRMQHVAKYLPEFIGRMIIHMTCEPCDVTLSNIPGPRKQITLFGHKIEDIMPVTPHSCTSGFSILGLTYNGKFKFALYQDTSVKVDTKRFIEIVEQEIDSHIE